MMYTGIIDRQEFVQSEEGVCMSAHDESTSAQGGAAPVRMAFSGFQRRATAVEDAEITHVLPGTPLGEYLRKFWQPVCLSSQLKDVPHPIRILGEDLVAFRDLSGQIGV